MFCNRQAKVIHHCCRGMSQFKAAFSVNDQPTGCCKSVCGASTAKGWTPRCLWKEATGSMPSVCMLSTECLQRFCALKQLRPSNVVSFGQQLDWQPL
jgi:hypothetical protein